MSICEFWKSSKHLELEDIYTIPLFDASLDLMCSDFGMAEVPKFDTMLQ